MRTAPAYFAPYKRLRPGEARSPALGGRRGLRHASRHILVRSYSPKLQVARDLLVEESAILDLCLNEHLVEALVADLDVHATRVPDGRTTPLDASGSIDEQPDAGVRSGSLGSQVCTERRAVTAAKRATSTRRSRRCSRKKPRSVIKLTNDLLGFKRS